MHTVATFAGVFGRRGLALIIAVVLSMPLAAEAEWYVGGEAGVNFADDLHRVEGTDGLFGLRAPDFDLKNSIVYGAKLGNYFGNGWFGLEGEVLNTTPHVKNLDDIPGFHLRVTTLALNVVARYPGRSIQPYGGIGFALLIAHMGASPTTRSDSDVGGGFNALAGIRFFLTPYIALFTEYKYFDGSLRFDNAFIVGGGFRADYRAQYVLTGLTYHF
jgi:opacity protein-like surface antigen